MEPTIHQVERRERRGRRIPALAVAAGVTLLASTWLGLFSFLGSNSAYGTVDDLRDRFICDVADYEFDFPDLGRLSEVYTSDGVLLGKLHLRNSQPVALDDIPPLVIGALLSAEDAKFYEHEGIDFRAIARAAIADVRGGGISQGGSTITQQVVKQNILVNPEKTLERKMCEAVIAAELERRYTKDDILEFYANSAFYGYNAYGVLAAAQEYFGKDLDELTIAESAMLFTPIRNPSLYDARNPNRIANVLRARNDVIDEMADNGYITVAQATTAKRDPLGVIEHQDFAELEPAVLIAAREEILNDASYGLGDTYSERSRMLFGCPAKATDCEGGGGLKITVTVDWNLQQEAARILRAWLPQQYEGPTGALAMVDNRTGAVKVMAGGLEFGEDIAAGQRPYDLATKGRRQAGSAFKPLALVTALEYGTEDGSPITLGSYWDYTSPQEIDCGFPCSPEGNIWTVYNASRGGKGIRTLDQATYASTNTVYAQVSLATGPENIVEMSHRLGIESPLNPVLSIALGTQTVSPLEMAAAYSTIANYGEKRSSYLIERIEDAAGNVLYEHRLEPEQVIDQALAAAVVATLEKVPTSAGTAPRANIGRPQAGKTGTAQNFRDVWFVGFIPQYTTAVWVGYPDAQIEMVNFVIHDDVNGQDVSIARAYGGTVAGPIWAHFMTYVTEELPVEDFPEEPPGTAAYRTTPSTEVPDVMALAGTDPTKPVDWEEVESLVYKAGLNLEKVEQNSLEEAGVLLEQSPEAGTSIVQGRTVTVTVSNGLPPEAPLPAGFLIGLHRDQIPDAITAFTAETEVRVNWVITEAPTPDAALHNRVITTVPAPGQLIIDQGTLTIVVGVPQAPPAP